MMSIILLFLKGIWTSFIKKALELFNYLISHPKVLAALVLVAVLGYGYLEISHLKTKVTKLEGDVATVTQQRDRFKAEAETLQSNLDTCKTVNADNQTIIEGLSAGKALTQQQLDALRAKNKQTTAELETLRGQLASKQDGPLAPVLADTIADVQANRAKRVAP
jgi:FtsZ-binding cell division protein ZapB